MITLLAKLFITDHTNMTLPAVRMKYGVLAGITGIFLNLVLFGAKLFAGTYSGSIAITADAFNNLSDAGSSVVSLFGIRMATHKADSGHPFGHGRIEYVAGLVVSIIIILMGFELFRSSLDNLFRPQPMVSSPLAVIILAVSVFVKLYMSFYNRKIGTKVNAPSMKAASLDSLSDSVATTAVLISILFYNTTGLNLDAYFGVLVSVFIFTAGIRSLKETVNPLLGQPPSAEYVKQIENIVMSHEGVTGFHDLIVHDYGPGRTIISLHAEVPAKGDLLLMHDMIDNIENELRNVMGCDVVVHMDPIVTDDECTLATKAAISALMKEIDPRFLIHDFRMVTGPTHTNMIFDIVVPHGSRQSDEQLRKLIVQKVSSLGSQYKAVVQIEQSYINTANIKNGGHSG